LYLIITLFLSKRSGKLPFRYCLLL
jgi:hypothetical protein